MNLVRAACVAAVLAALAVVPSSASAAHPAAAQPLNAVRAGDARFEVLSPTLIRLEYAPDGHFEDRPTMVARDRTPVAAFTTRRAHGVLTIRTSGMVLRYRIASGRLSPKDVRVHLAGRPGSLAGWSKRSGPDGGGRTDFGGWIRALDDRQGPVSIHHALVNGAGWYLLKDSADPVVTEGTAANGWKPTYTARRPVSGYQDGYLFGYGNDLGQALRDLRTLTGPAPLLPRTAFGVWFSRYYAYAAAQYPHLLQQFRNNKVPLDTLSIDTDWKRQPSPLSPILASTVVGHTAAWSWNGWEWNSTLFPDPKKFITWAHRHGVAIALNVHPSIDSTDPQYDATVAKTGPLKLDPTCTLQQIDPTGQCYVFDLSKQRQIAAYFALHAPIAADGVDEWWLDWCCDATTASAPGLTPDTWFNLLYANQLHRQGSRWLVLSRVGGSHQGDDPVAGPGPGIFAEHRYAIHFTGDTCATWGMVAFEAYLTAEEGAVGLPYVSHDIGSFNGAPIRGQCGASAGSSGSKLPAQMYARWVQLGAFQPILRLHSNHGARLPWEYPKAADRAAAKALRLRESLVPYLYTVARETYDTGLPIVRSLPLQWYPMPASWRHPSEYTVGKNVLVRPVVRAGNPAPATVWFPPGKWIDYFTGRTYVGPSLHTFSVPLGRMPVYVRAGTVLPRQSAVEHSTPGPRDHLILDVFGRRDGSGRLYDDAGEGFGYQHGAYSWITFRHAVERDRQRLRIGAAVGEFPGSLSQRSWTIRFRDVARPDRVTVAGHVTPWHYDRSTRTLTVRTSELATDRSWTVRVHPSAPG